jgi:hypothetical protein
MSGPCCDNCIYSVVDAELWRKLMWLGEPILPRCGNHPMYPGQVHEVSGMACPNYRRRPPVPQGDFRVIPLDNGSYAYVDAADYEGLSRWKWHESGGGYAARNARGKTILMHRQIMKPRRGKLVDHKDGNRGNNCRANLRLCTRAENQRNMHKQNGSVSRFKGVAYDRRCDKWVGRCWYAGGDHFLGYYDDEAEAARAHDRRAVEVLGEFARLNFPREWPPQRRAEVRAQRDAAKEKVKRRKARRKAKVKSEKVKRKPKSRRKTRDG